MALLSCCKRQLWGQHYPWLLLGGVGRNHIDSSMHTVYWYTDPLHPHPTQSTTLTTISVTKWVRGGYRAFQCVSLTRIKFHPFPLREDMILCVTGKWRVKGSSGGRRRNSRYVRVEKEGASIWGMTEKGRQTQGVLDSDRTSFRKYT